MGRIYDTMISFFEEDDWNFTPLEEGSSIMLGFRGEAGRWPCYSQVREKQQQVLFYSVSPVNVPEALRPAVAEYLTRANYGLLIGNFEMDYSDGEVRFKTSIDVEDAGFVPKHMRNLVYANCIMMDRYLPGLMAVIHGGRSPAEAILMVEGPPDSGEA